jgi:hypothetical protein
MIALASDCLLVRTGNGESIPYSVDMLSVELAGDTVEMFEEEFVHNAADAVFHYFKHELGLQTVSLGEFAGALEKVLRGFAASVKSPAARRPKRVLESDLFRLARESGEGRELAFFPRLRAELREQLQQTPSVLRFRGLRGCVKHLVGVRRWSVRCEALQGQIISYLRECLSAEVGAGQLALVVE